MKGLVQFLRPKWEEILVTGILVPLVLPAVSATDPVMIALNIIDGVISSFGM